MNSKKLLINLSNHPISEWSEQQLVASNEYGRCLDFPFPRVDPQDSIDRIVYQSSQVVERVLNIIEKEQAQGFTTIHVMGEMTMTMALVQSFQRRNIECIASTANRFSKLVEPGKKLITFKFVRFRTFPIL